MVSTGEGHSRKRARERTKRIKPPGSDIFSQRSSPSIVCAEAFHFRVRDGNGWVHLSLTTKRLLNYSIALIRRQCAACKETIVDMDGQSQ